jgi:O-antigen ligase
MGVVCVLYAISCAPPIGDALDRALLLLCVVVVVQLVPLPGLVSSETIRVRAALSLSPALEPGWGPLTIDVAQTAWAAIELVGAVALFVAVRDRFASGGIRRAVRAIAIIGLAVSALAIAQSATAGRSIYWLFETEHEGPLPLGPFVNRNHFATWAIMVIPLCLGYVAAHAQVHRSPGQETSGSISAALSRIAWLIAAITLLSLALVISLSRSAAAGLGVSGLITLFAVRSVLEPSQRRRLIVATAVLLILAMSWTDASAVRDKVAGSTIDFEHRTRIWRESLPIVRDFLPSGTGAGTYELAMRVYQQSDRRVYFNQAHNHYLQLLVEGGLLLTIPFVLAAVAFVRVARQRLGADRSGMRWVRVGAACGLGAVAIQSIWETGLVMSANATLAAVLAAIVVHERR